MGKNQQHVAKQARKSRTDLVEEEAGGVHDIDASFHTAEWHAARLAALQVERPSWEEWQKKRRVQEARCDTEITIIAIQGMNRLSKDRYTDGAGNKRRTICRRRS